MEWIGLILQIILLGAFLFWEGYNKKKGENQALKEEVMSGFKQLLMQSGYTDLLCLVKDEE